MRKEDCWKTAEAKVKEEYEKKGYVVLSQNDKGFPDLIAIKDGKIAFFVEVKAMQKPDLGRYEVWYHQYLNSLGFEVKCDNVLDEEPKPFYPDREWAEAIREDNPLLEIKPSHDS